jgi:hypothetical protein
MYIFLKKLVKQMTNSYKKTLKKLDLLGLRNRYSHRKSDA